MYTSIDKAITALVMAALFLLNQFGVVPWTPDAHTQDTVGTIIALLTPVLVYLIPNKKV